MSADGKKPNVLFRLAAEGLVPVLGGCAGALAGGPQGGLIGVAVGQVVEKAVNLFGRGIVERWAAWFARTPPADAAEAVGELVTLTPADARDEARAILLELAPDADPADVAVAVEYLSALPRSVDRALVPDPAGGPRTLPPTVSLADPRSLLQLLPEDVPPYPTGADLPNTPYRLVELLGAGGFGAVYRAFAPTLQHLPLAIKFCLDRSLLPALNQERSNLERLMRAGGAGGGHVVKLYGYDLDHPTPFLVYEYVRGGDLTVHLAARRAAGTPPGPAEVIGWVAQIADGLAFAHRAGVVHRDLKPANVLVEGARGRGQGAWEEDGFPLAPRPMPLAPVRLKLADFGIGAVSAVRAAARSRIGSSTMEYLSLADQASLFRGAGTPLYMSPEQRRGAAPDPRHDLYALGVVWFQLLVGDVTRELPHGWAKELTVRFGVPAGQVALIERCVGWFDDRPKDAGELLPLLRAAAGEPVTVVAIPPAEPVTAPAPETAKASAAVTPTTGTRRTLLVSLLDQLAAAHDELAVLRRRSLRTTVVWGCALGLLTGLIVSVGTYVYDEMQPRPSWGTRQTDWAYYSRVLLIGLPAGGAYVLVIRSAVGMARSAARRQAQETADELARDFPAEVAQWGGLGVLKNPATARQVREAIEPPAVAPSSPTVSLSPEEVTADPTRRAVLVGRLRDLDLARQNTFIKVAWTWVGLVLLWVVAAPVLGMATAGVLHKHFDAANEVTWLAGTVVGLAVAVGSWVAMAAIRRAVRRWWDEAVARFAADYPRVVAAWGGPDILRSQETLAGLLTELTTGATGAVPAGGLSLDEVTADPARKAVLVSRLRHLSRVLKYAQYKSAAAWAGLGFLWLVDLNLTIGVLLRPLRDGGLDTETVFAFVGGVCLAIGGASWWAMARARAAVWRRVDAEADRFAADYPRLVESWGGTGMLRSPEALDKILVHYDPVRPPPGVRRWFGG